MESDGKKYLNNKEVEILRFEERIGDKEAVILVKNVVNKNETYCLASELEELMIKRNKFIPIVTSGCH